MSRLPLPASRAPAPPLKMRVKGFTLIEVLTTIAIIGILTAIALPNYREYVRRSTLVEAETTLSDLRVRADQYYLDNRNYGTGGNCGVTPLPVKYFLYNCCLGTLDANGACTVTAGQDYAFTATGSLGAAAGHDYTINQGNTRTTLTFQGIHQTGKNCWLITGSEC